MREPLNLEALEERLTPSWARVPPALVPAPESFVSPTFDYLGNSRGNALISSSEVDYYRFTAQTTGLFTFQANAASSRLDTVLAVFDASGRRIGQNDNISAGNRNSRVSLNLREGERYYLGISNLIGSSGGSYTWQINGPTPQLPDDVHEDNDVRWRASDLGVITTPRTIDSLRMSDAADWFRFDLARTGGPTSSVSITFDHDQGDLLLELYTGNGSFKRTSDGKGGGERLSLAGLGPGSYFVRVAGFQGAVNPDYTLSIDPTPVKVAARDFDIDLLFHGELSDGQKAIFRQAAAHWEQLIVGDLPSARYQGRLIDDLLIEISGQGIDYAGGILAEAAPDAFRAGSALPYHGFMAFDVVDLPILEEQGKLLEVALHEMAHVLGFGTIWSQRGLLAGRGTVNPRFTGRLAAAEYSALLGLRVNSVPVENTGGPGTRDAHWRDSLFGAELMTGMLDRGQPNPISRVTLASLEDLGYQVDLDALFTL